MVVRISSLTVRIAGTLALLLGLLFWSITEPEGLIPVHTLLGILVVLGVLVLGVLGLTAPGGNKGMAVAGIVVAILLVIVGFGQRSWLSHPGDPHWLIQVLHLVVALATIGLGEGIARGLRAARPAAA
ncbi:MAG TPA: hypothetical protein VF807_01580 [Ktedonobacterales bacterium]